MWHSRLHRAIAVIYRLLPTATWPSRCSTRQARAATHAGVLEVVERPDGRYRRAEVPLDRLEGSRQLPQEFRMLLARPITALAGAGATHFFAPGSRSCHKRSGRDVAPISCGVPFYMASLGRRKRLHSARKADKLRANHGNRSEQRSVVPGGTPGCDFPQ
jgi:hypothetical protein